MQSHQPQQINPLLNAEEEPQPDPLDFTFQIVDAHSTTNSPQFNESHKNSVAEEPESPESMPALSEPLGPLGPSDDIGLEKDLSLNQALNDAK